MVCKTIVVSCVPSASVCMNIHLENHDSAKIYLEILALTVLTESIGDLFYLIK